MLKICHGAISHPVVYGPFRQRLALRFGKVGGVEEWIGERQPRSRLTAVTFARDLHRLNIAGALLYIHHQLIARPRNFDLSLPILQYFTKEYFTKNRSHAETPCTKVSSWSIRPFRKYRRKTDPRGAETDSKLGSRVTLPKGPNVCI